MVATRLISIVPAMIVAISSSMTAGDALNQWLNILQSIQLPLAIVPLLVISRSKEVMRNDKHILGKTGSVAVAIFVCMIVGINVQLLVN